MLIFGNPLGNEPKYRDAESQSGEDTQEGQKDQGQTVNPNSFGSAFAGDDQNKRVS